MLNYFKIPEIEFNHWELYEAFINNKRDWAKYGESDQNSLHTKYIDIKDPAIKKIVEQFVNPDMIENVKFFKTKAGGKVNAHSDKRNVAVNIPVQTNDNNYTVFYKSLGEHDAPSINVEGKNMTVKAKRYKSVEPVESFMLYGAVCLNTKTPHGVVNESESDRIILSISFKDAYDDYNTVKKLYEQGNLTRTK